MRVLSFIMGRVKWGSRVSFNKTCTVRKAGTLSKAIGRDNFSIGAEAEEPDEDAVDGIEADDDAAVLMDENDDAGRSAYNTSWLLTDGSETAAAVMVDDEGSAASKLFRALSGGNLLLGGGSMAC